MFEGGALLFFSSRRRHTRCGRDWSSDVCSSDLVSGIPGIAFPRNAADAPWILPGGPWHPGEPTPVRPSLLSHGRLPAWLQIGRASCREGVYVRGDPFCVLTDHERGVTRRAVGLD